MSCRSMWPARSARHTPLALVFLALRAAASPDYVAELCRGQKCESTSYPMLDWNPETRRCICISHPCWNDDDGKRHVCPDPDYPHLAFSYNDTKALKCGCSATADTTTRHVARDLCYGSRCDDPNFPILNYNKTSGKCMCSENPCWNVDGLRHSCDTEEAPVLTMRLGADGRKVCECRKSYSKYSQTEICSNSDPLAAACRLPAGSSLRGSISGRSDSSFPSILM